MKALLTLPLVLVLGCRTPQPVIELPGPLPPPQTLWRELPEGSSLRDEVAALVHDWFELDRAWRTREEQLKALRQSSRSKIPVTTKADR